MYNNKSFVKCCSRGDLGEVINMFNETKNIDIHFNKDEAFRTACFNGHLNVAKWLMQFDNINIHIYDEQVFNLSCINGHIDIAKWLVQIDDNIDIHKQNDKVFRWTFYNEQFEINKWLLQLDYYDLNLLNEYIDRLPNINYLTIDILKNRRLDEIVDPHIYKLDDHLLLKLSINKKIFNNNILNILSNNIALLKEVIDSIKKNNFYPNLSLRMICMINLDKNNPKYYQLPPHIAIELE